MNELTRACELCGGSCWSCFYADLCGEWLQDGTGIPLVAADGSVSYEG